MRFLCQKKILCFIILALIIFCKDVKALPQIEATYEEEILVEKGWTKYITITVKNTGNKVLNNVIISMENDHPEWFKVTDNKTILYEGDSKIFTVKLEIPVEVEVGIYQFLLFLRSDEIAQTEPLSLQIFSSKSDMLLQQLQNLRRKIEKLKEGVDIAEMSGKDVNDIKISLEGATSIIGTAEKYINNNMFNDAVDKIKNIEYLLKEAEYELSVAPEKENESVNEDLDLSLIAVFLIIVIVIFISIRKKKLKVENIGIGLKSPDLKIKKLVIGKGAGKIEKQIIELEKSQELLDEEYKKKIISKESYEELSLINQQKILELKQKVRE